MTRREAASHALLVEALLNAAKAAGMWPARVRLTPDGDAVVEPCPKDEPANGVTW